MNILLPNKDFNFDKLSLVNPQGLQGGSYFSKCFYDNKPIFLQIPKCVSKNGIVKTGKKIYIDLQFNNYNTNFTQWIEEFEKHIKKLILEKSDKWFDNDMEEEDIDYFFNTCIRTYKTNYSLLRTYIQKPRNIKDITIQIFNENEELCSLEDIKSTTNIISILEVKGIKFTNSSFHIDTCLRQVMILQEKKIFNKCMIKLQTNKIKLDKTNKDNDIDIDTTTNIDDNESEVSNDIDEASNGVEETVLPCDNTQNNEITVIEEGVSTLDNIDNIENDNNYTSTNINTIITDEPNNNLEETINNLDTTTEIQLNNDVPLIDEPNLTEITDSIEIDDETITDNNEKVIIKPSQITNPNTLEEIDITLDNLDEAITLNKPNDIYYTIYKEAKDKARLAKQEAIKAYLKAKHIKSTYLLDEIESSDDDLSVLSFNSNDSNDTDYSTEQHLEN